MCLWLIRNLVRPGTRSIPIPQLSYSVISRSRPSPFAMSDYSTRSKRVQQHPRQLSSASKRFYSVAENSENLDCQEGLEAVYQVDGVAIPENLVEFIVVEKFVPLLTFPDLSRGSSDFPMEERVEESSIFRNNNLLHSVRARLGKDLQKQAESTVPLRLKKLAGISYSHGISWESLDSLYSQFHRAKTEAFSHWERHKHDLIQFANQVAVARIRGSKTLCHLSGSGRLTKLLTQQYYSRWLNCYMAPFGIGMLSRFLKAQVTISLLNRESGELGSPLEIPPGKTSRNPYFSKEP